MIPTTYLTSKQLQSRIMDCQPTARRLKSASTPLSPMRPYQRRFVGIPLALLLMAFSSVFSWAAEDQEEPEGAVLRVENALATAMSNNPNLAQMQARYEALAEIPSQLGTLPDPVLSLKAANLPTNSFDLDQEPMTQMQIGISQVLPFPGKLSLREDASQYEAQAAGHSVDEVRLRLAKSVKTSWWQLYYLDRALEIVASNQDLLRNFIQVAKTKYEVGMGLQQDVLLAQLELSRLIDQEIKLQTIRRNEAIRLNVLMDLPANAAVVLPKQASMQMPDIADETDLIQAQITVHKIGSTTVPCRDAAVADSDPIQSSAAQSVASDNTLDTKCWIPRLGAIKDRFVGGDVSLASPDFEARESAEDRDVACEVNGVGARGLIHMVASGGDPDFASAGGLSAEGGGVDALLDAGQGGLPGGAGARVGHGALVHVDHADALAGLAVAGVEVFELAGG